jgi:hypothetical protein
MRPHGLLWGNTDGPWDHCDDKRAAPSVTSRVCDGRRMALLDLSVAYRYTIPRRGTEAGAPVRVQHTRGYLVRL